MTAITNLNPVKAIMVKSAWDYRCSSVHGHIIGNDSEFSIAPRISRPILMVLRPSGKKFFLDWPAHALTLSARIQNCLRRLKILWARGL